MNTETTETEYAPLVFSKSNKKQKTEVIISFWNMANHTKNLTENEIVECLVLTCFAYAKEHKIALVDFNAP